MKDEIATQSFFSLIERSLHLGQEIIHGAAIGAGHKAGVGIEHRRLRGREKVETQAAAGQKADSHDGQGQGTGDRGAPMLETVSGEAPEPAFPEPVEPLFKALPETFNRARLFRLRRLRFFLAPGYKGMAQVRGQHDKTLKQRSDQNTDHHQWYITQDIADDSAHHQKRHEGRNGGQRRGQYRPDHAFRCTFRGIDGLLSHSGMGIGILAHHNGIVDDHPQCHDQCKQGNHVDGTTDQPEHCHGRQKGSGYPDGHPQGHPTRQKQVQQTDHQHQTAQTVFHQQGNTIIQQLPGLIVHLQFHRWRQHRPSIRQPVFQDFGRFQRIAVFRSLQLQLNRRLAVLFQRYLALTGLLTNDGDIAKMELNPLTTEHRNVLKFLRAASLLNRAQFPGGVLLRHHAGGQVAGNGRHTFSYLFQ